MVHFAASHVIGSFMALVKGVAIGVVIGFVLGAFCVGLIVLTMH